MPVPLPGANEVNVEELRARFSLIPKSAGAVLAGSVGPWERGEISPFQRAHGEAAATEAGRPYDPHGAEP
jgi:hypothetical protein